jgi:hypothetical protein
LEEEGRSCLVRVARAVVVEDLGRQLPHAMEGEVEAVVERIVGGLRDYSMSGELVRFPTEKAKMVEAQEYFLVPQVQ